MTEIFCFCMSSVFVPFLRIIESNLTILVYLNVSFFGFGMGRMEKRGISFPFCCCSYSFQMLLGYLYAYWFGFIFFLLWIQVAIGLKVGSRKGDNSRGILALDSVRYSLIMYWNDGLVKVFYNSNSLSVLWKPRENAGGTEKNLIGEEGGTWLCIAEISRLGNFIYKFEKEEVLWLNSPFGKKAKNLQHWRGFNWQFRRRNAIHLLKLYLNTGKSFIWISKVLGAMRSIA